MVINGDDDDCGDDECDGDDDECDDDDNLQAKQNFRNRFKRPPPFF